MKKYFTQKTLRILLIILALLSIGLLILSTTNSKITQKSRTNNSAQLIDRNEYFVDMQIRLLIPSGMSVSVSSEDMYIHHVTLENSGLRVLILRQAFPQDYIFSNAGLGFDSNGTLIKAFDIDTTNDYVVINQERKVIREKKFNSNSIATYQSTNNLNFTSQTEVETKLIMPFIQDYNTLYDGVSLSLELKNKNATQAEQTQYLQLGDKILQSILDNEK